MITSPVYTVRFGEKTFGLGVRLLYLLFFLFFQTGFWTWYATALLQTFSRRSMDFCCLPFVQPLPSVCFLVCPRSFATARPTATPPPFGTDTHPLCTATRYLHSPPEHVTVSPRLRCRGTTETFASHRRAHPFPFKRPPGRFFFFPLHLLTHFVIAFESAYAFLCGRSNHTRVFFYPLTSAVFLIFFSFLSRDFLHSDIGCPCDLTALSVFGNGFRQTSVVRWFPPVQP